MLQEVSIKSIVVHQSFTTKILHYTEPTILFLVEELKDDSKETILESVKDFQKLIIQSEGLLLTTSAVYQNLCFERDAYLLVEKLEDLQQKECIPIDKTNKELFNQIEDILNESFASGDDPIFIDFG
jgi:hypothetical protein